MYRIVVLFSIVVGLNVKTSNTEPIDRGEAQLMAYFQDERGKPLENEFGFRSGSSVLRKKLNLGDEEEEEEDGIDQFRSIDQLDDVQLTQLSNYLVQALYRPVLLESPIVVLKDSQDSGPEEDGLSETDYGRSRAVVKKARLYMQYPGKRHNSRTYRNMDYDVCSPSKHDVFQLLKALHEVRQGNNQARFINFCNRRRPANAVYTNIRFLGRRRK